MSQPGSLSSLTTLSETVMEVKNHVRWAMAISRLHAIGGDKENEHGKPRTMKAENMTFTADKETKYFFINTSEQ